MELLRPVHPVLQPAGDTVPMMASILVSILVSIMVSIIVSIMAPGHGVCNLGPRCDNLHEVGYRWAFIAPITRT